MVLHYKIAINMNKIRKLKKIREQYNEKVEGNSLK